jgi:hypothetical protein
VRESVPFTLASWWEEMEWTGRDPGSMGCGVGCGARRPVGRIVGAVRRWIAAVHGREVEAVLVWMVVHHELNYCDRRSWMAVREQTDVELAGELETIATAAADRMRALSDGDVER